jgi:hypothetical protein
MRRLEDHEFDDQEGNQLMVKVSYTSVFSDKETQKKGY